jgi:hypothetical protein
VAAGEAQRLRVAAGIGRDRTTGDEGAGWCLDDGQHMLVAVRIDSDDVLRLCNHPF